MNDEKEAAKTFAEAQKRLSSYGADGRYFALYSVSTVNENTGCSFGCSFGFSGEAELEILARAITHRLVFTPEDQRSDALAHIIAKIEADLKILEGKGE